MWNMVFDLVVKLHQEVDSFFLNTFVYIDPYFHKWVHKVRYPDLAFGT